jgi:retinol dehydrogenase-13
VTQSGSNSDHVHVELCDLASKQSIASLVGRVSEKFGALDVLVNNAAIVPQEKTLSGEGIEMQFAVNVLAYYRYVVFMYGQEPIAIHFRLMMGFLPLLSNSNISRIVNLASNYAGDLDMGDLMFDKRPYDSNTAYRQSKQCNRMLSWAAASAFEEHGVSVNACHPGVVTTQLLQGLGMSKGLGCYI